MRRAGLVLLSGLVVSAVAGCAPPPQPHGREPGARGEGRTAEGRGVFISPMGEPFRGPDGRMALIGQWFAGADADRDGRVTLAEFQADAARFFATLDTDHDGEIDPDELRHYENEVAPEIRVRDAGVGARNGNSGGGGRGGRSGGGGHGGGGGGGRHRGGGSSSDAGSGPTTPHQSPGVQGAARYGLLDLPEPVAAADADFNRSITRREFAAAAAMRFDLLDADSDGGLTLAKLTRR